VIGYFYIAFFIFAILYYFYSPSQDAFISLVLLGAAALLPYTEIWATPAEIIKPHFFIFLFMAACIHDESLMRKMGTLSFFVVASDLLWVWMPEFNFTQNTLNFPYGSWVWHSVINLLFFAQCVVTWKGCYNARKINGKIKSKGGSYGNIAMSEGAPVASD